MTKRYRKLHLGNQDRFYERERELPQDEDRYLGALSDLLTDVFERYVIIYNDLIEDEEDEICTEAIDWLEGIIDRLRLTLQFARRAPQTCRFE